MPATKCLTLYSMLTSFSSANISKGVHTPVVVDSKPSKKKIKTILIVLHFLSKIKIRKANKKSKVYLGSTVNRKEGAIGVEQKFEDAA